MSLRLKIMLLLFFQTLLFNISFGQNNNDFFNTIDVQWKDFKIVDMPKNQNIVAKIVIHHAQDIQYTLQKNKVTILLNNQMQLDSSKSIVDKNYLKTASMEDLDALLIHEKGHYIISIFYHYKLMEDIKKYDFTKNYKQEIKQVIAKNNEERNKMNFLYDKETKHHMDSKQQNIWNEKLKKMYHEYVKDKPTYTLISEVTFTI